MNERDSEAVSSLLARHGHTLAAVESEADITIVNTCAVRGKAEDKALGKLGLLVAEKNASAGRIVGAMGCVVQRLKGAIFEKVPGLDFAVGTHSLADLPRVLNHVIDGGGPVLDAREDGERFDELSGHARRGISAFVNILLGCNRHCSYCIVPDVRGREWSRSAVNIMDEVRELIGGGVREVTLLGQSVMSYGRSNDVWPKGHVSGRRFSEPLSMLLEAVSKIEGLKRVRFTSGHPSGCTNDLARAMAELPEVCEHLHLPVQSGSDRILRMMRRGYVTEDYRRAVKRLRAAVPGIAVTTDIIVGFPSETLADFEMTRHFMEEIGFDNSFIFKYSSRPGTAAEKWDDDVPDGEKMRRNKVLLAEQDRHSLAVHAGLAGTDVEVLVEGISPRNSSRWFGRTSTNKIVVFRPTSAVRAGDLVNVKICHVTAQTLRGEVYPPGRPRGALHRPRTANQGSGDRK